MVTNQYGSCVLIYNLHNTVSGEDRLVMIGSRISIQGNGMHVKEV